MYTNTIELYCCHTSAWSDRLHKSEKLEIRYAQHCTPRMLLRNSNQENSNRENRLCQRLQS